ncbi:DUF4190 domain-containing protein [Streptomyces sp. SBST2-5]|uniref:DUF4190 domain-containing protein n=1 Tax=Streptomyces composti TaxID=2720025 RepID=A0ABX1A8P7_9ACTN|nr:DUF4190 domain-containing protein [Streptomyces composti]NJP52864.1 DUF4190 domain-containing protein [Streptomyces composti]
MTDATQPGGPDAGNGDPWAPPERRTSLEKNDTPRAAGPAQPSGTPTVADGVPAQPGPSVHDQPTVVSMPGAGFAPPHPPPPPAGATPPAGSAPFDGGPGSAVPPPPVAPTGPGAPAGYGYPGYGAGYGWPGMPGQRQNGFGIASMVLGILACCLFCVYGVVSVVLGILAIVFGVKGRRKAEEGLADNHGQAQAGLIMGVIGLVLGLIVVVLIAIGITAAINSDPDSWEDDEPYYGAARPTAAAPAFG